MNIFPFFRKTIKKIDDTKEYSENIIASIFENIQGNKNIDNGERILTGTIIEIIEAKTGISIPEEVKNGIKEGVVSGLDKANILLVKQLRK